VSARSGVQETIDCEMCWKLIFKQYPTRFGSQCPVLFGREIHHFVLRISLIIDRTVSPEFWASPVPAGVRAVVARNTEQLVFVLAGIGVVRVPTGATGVGLHSAGVCFVLPASAFETLKGFGLDPFS
jgi:hypothetical protein